MSKFQIYLPAPSNKLQGYKFGIGYPMSARRANGRNLYDLEDVIDTLNTTDFSNTIRWCEMRIKEPTHHDMWLDRIILKDRSKVHIEILLIMRESQPIHPKSKKFKQKQLKTGDTHYNYYKVALMNRKTKQIMFRTVFLAKLGIDKQVGWCETNTDGWFQLRTPERRVHQLGADITFWKELKSRLI